MAKKEKKEEITIQKFLDEVEDVFGEYIIVREGEEESELKAIPTGSLSLDVSIGIGGIPVGRFTELHGPESSGKTTLALSFCRQALLLGKTVLYLDAEIGLDWSYIRSCVGEDVLEFEMTVIDGEEVEVCTNFILITPETGEQAFHIAERGIRDNLFGLIILDSLGAVSLEKERDDALDKANIALLPKLLARFLRRNAWALKSSHTAFVFINQVRDNIGSFYSSFITPGGHSLKHYISLEIALFKSKVIKKGQEEVGISIRFYIKKNKLSIPLRGHTIPLIFGKGMDYFRDVIEFCTTLGVIKQRGPYYTFDGETLASGLENSANIIREDKELLDKIIRACYNIIGGKVQQGEMEEDEEEAVLQKEDAITLDNNE